MEFTTSQGSSGDSMDRELQEFGSIREDIPQIVSSFKSAPYDENMGNTWAVSLEPWGNHLNPANLIGKATNDVLYKHTFLLPNLYSAIKAC